MTNKIKSISGRILKMEAKLSETVNYYLPINNETIHINSYLGKQIHFEFLNKIQCIGCDKITSKSFNQGYCFHCFKTKASCDICILKPELCHYAKGTCREPEWGLKHCMIEHYVYLANSSSLKIGITRCNQIPTRWIDQGAIKALLIARVKSRYESGLAEEYFRQFVKDKTQWQKMLKGEFEAVDLLEKREDLLLKWPKNIEAELLRDSHVVSINYPVLEYPKKVKALSLEKESKIEGVLLGVKGQYLILDCGVINLRKYQGYHISWQV